MVIIHRNLLVGFTRQNFLPTCPSWMQLKNYEKKEMLSRASLARDFRQIRLWFAVGSRLKGNDKHYIVFPAKCVLNRKTRCPTSSKRNSPSYTPCRRAVANSQTAMSRGRHCNTRYRIKPPPPGFGRENVSSTVHRPTSG